MSGLLNPRVSLPRVSPGFLLSGLHSEMTCTPICVSVLQYSTKFKVTSRLPDVAPKTALMHIRQRKRETTKGKGNVGNLFCQEAVRSPGLERRVWKQTLVYSGPGASAAPKVSFSVSGSMAAAYLVEKKLMYPSFPAPTPRSHH